MHSLARTESTATDEVDPSTGAPDVDHLARRLATIVDNVDMVDRTTGRGGRDRSDHDRSDRRTAPDGGAGTLRFRGATYDDAVRAAEEALGVTPRVVAAHRIRRGGIGGFFATDLGVEVQVTTEGETIDQAVERLVEASSRDDRAEWIRELARAAGIDTLEPLDQPATRHHDEPGTEAAGVTGANGANGATDPPGPAEPTDEYLPDLVFERPPSRLGTPTSPSAPPVPVPEPVEPATSDPGAGTSPDHVDDHVDDHGDDPGAATTGRGPSAPTRRQVDLAVVATSELVRLTGGQSPGTTVSIQVTVTTADGRSVSTEARIETPRTPRRAANRTGASS